jgi:hypothetical protein
VVERFEELSALRRRFSIARCVIDGLPETHATRDFAREHPYRVFLNFFNENQRGSARWDRQDFKVEINRDGGSGCLPGGGRGGTPHPTPPSWTLCLYNEAPRFGQHGTAPLGSRHGRKTALLLGRKKKDRPH